MLGNEPRTLYIHTRFTSAPTSHGLSPDFVVTAPSLFILCGGHGGSVYACIPSCLLPFFLHVRCAFMCVCLFVCLCFYELDVHIHVET